MNDFDIDHRHVAAVADPPLEHSHDRFEIAFFIQARLSIFVKDINYTIGDGDLLLINEYDIHRIVYSPRTPYTRYVIHFSRSFLSSYLQQLGISDLFRELAELPYQKVTLNLKQTTELQSLFQALLKLSPTPSDREQPALTTALLKSYLLIILSKFRELVTAATPVGNYKKDHQVQSIIQYIDRHYMDQLNLDGLAQRFHLSKFHISHIFKAVTGFTVNQYLQRRRIVEAQKLLQDPAADPVDVSFRCGFNHLQHFYRVFKAIAQTTPARYQRKHSAR